MILFNPSHHFHPVLVAPKRPEPLKIHIAVPKRQTVEILEEVHITVPAKRQSSLLENILLSDTPDERKHKFLTSRKGGVQLIHEEYLYRSNLRRQGKEGDILYWECIHNRGTKCRGRLKTVGNTIHKSNGKVQRTDLYADASPPPPPTPTKKPPMNATELKFIKSPWSTPCLVLDNYLYNCHSTRGDIGYWRCHNYSRKVKEERCRARCVIKCGRLSALTGAQHNHPPHTEKIDRIMRRNYADEQMQECQQQQQEQQQEQFYQAAPDTHRNRDMIMLVASNTTTNRHCSREAVVEMPVELAVVNDGNGHSNETPLPTTSSSVIAHLLTNGIKLDDYTLPVVEM
ncbi:hypothetical protein ZHAS_00021576 [Anopheles sinensis]|uniref:FLYWCH-type domain-containing protein n=1 Tax=Anopheles sinensis TaxID=74873 RepID=A0A084WSS8_ANOSI|nr:hypothetical protein ZHAS_00021576 [Anopheles sinensis]